MILERLLFLWFNFDLLECRMEDFSIISSRSTWYSQECMSDMLIFLHQVMKFKLSNLSVCLFCPFVGITSFEFGLSVLFQWLEILFYLLEVRVKDQYISWVDFALEEPWVIFEDSHSFETFVRSDWIVPLQETFLVLTHFWCIFVDLFKLLFILADLWHFKLFFQVRI